MRINIRCGWTIGETRFKYAWFPKNIDGTIVWLEWYKKTLIDERYLSYYGWARWWKYELMNKRSDEM